MKWQIVLMNLLKSEKWLARYFMKTFKPTWQNFFRSKTCPRLNFSYYVDFFLSMYSCVSRLCLLPVIQNAHFFQFFIQTLKITLACLYVSWAIVFCRKKILFILWLFYSSFSKQWLLEYFMVYFTDFEIMVWINKKAHSKQEWWNFFSFVKIDNRECWFLKLFFLKILVRFIVKHPA